jgi:pimeloyl-ACP methyl ester carboxylesterase
VRKPGPGCPAERRTCLIDGREIAYEVAGAGPPVVLVHGLAGSTRWWDACLPGLTERLTVYAVDLPGFGENRRTEPFALEKAAERLAAWTDVVRLERASIVGHSMGGYVAADLAARFPERVERLVLVDAVVRPYDDPLRQPVRGVLDMARTLPVRYWRILLSDALRAGPATLHNATRAVLAADLRPRLGQIAAPTLVIWGERDNLVPLEYGKLLAETLPNASLEVIEGAGHNPMWDRPEELNHVLIRFLTGEVAEYARPQEK